MAMFVHLTPEKNVNAIQRAGIALRRKAGTRITRFRKANSRPEGIFAMPVTRNFYVSHQWLRELKRGGQRTIWAVYFRVPDEEQVWIGHYNEHHLFMSAAEAASIIISSACSEGYEVIIPRKILSGEIHRVRRLRQVIGWRYMPGAHKLSTCMCIVCNPPGSIKSRKKWRAWEEGQAEP